MKRLALLIFGLITAGLQLMMAQGIVVTGRTSEAATGEPLPGVTIQVKGTMTGTVSSVDGTYKLTVADASSTLVFSYVGYKTAEVAINGQNVVDVALDEEVTSLQEIVVTGYSTEKKKDIIGSVAVVNTEEMLSTPSGNVTAQIAGRVAGVSVSSDGTLGGASKVRVRGFGSFASSEPLYIIDGVPTESVERLNPNDIESMQFLKDAASASVYGSRAASGVVIITTRQGKEGPVKVNLDAYSGVNYVSKNNFPDLLDAQELGNLIWKSYENAGIAAHHEQYGNGATPVVPEYVLAVDPNGIPRGGAYLEGLKTSDPALFASLTDPANYNYATRQIVKSANTDWFDEVYNPAPVKNIQLSAAGGSDRGNFSIALNYFDQKQTSDKYSYYKRYTLRANSTFNIKKIIRVGENLQVSYNEGRNVGYPASAWTMPSILPVWDIAGNPTGGKAPDISKTGDGGNGNSPISAAWHDRFDKYYNYGMFGNIFADVTLFKDLVARTSFGLDFYYRQNRDLTQTTYENAENNNLPNTLQWRTDDRAAWTWTNTLTYSKTLGVHTVKLLVGSEAINDVASYHYAQITDFVINNDPYFLVPSAGTGSKTLAGSYTPIALFSYFGRFDYTYKDKYIFNATVRRDGSSKFGSNNRFGNFPAAAVGWRLSSEEFMKSLTWLTDLKLRASYGIVGNQGGNLSYDNQFTTFVSSVSENYPINGLNNSVVTSYTKSRKGNSNAKWEKTTTTNVGLDASFFQGGLTLNVDIYKKKTTDLLVQNQAPSTEAAVTQPYVNVGDIQNNGIDINLAKRGKLFGQLDYEVSANFSKYKNKVLNILDNPNAQLVGGATRMGNATITKEGMELSSFYGWKLDGFIDTQEELDQYNSAVTSTWLVPRIGGWKLKDVSGPNGEADGLINDFDRVVLGTPHPDFQMGFNISLGWKGFDFSTFIFWSQGGQLVNQSRYNVDFNTYAFNRSARMLYESWTPENHDARLPMLNINDVSSAKYFTDYFVEDATYVRMKTLQLGYTVPAKIVSKIKLDRVRLYVQGQNLLTWTKFSGLDPGISISGTTDISMGVVNNYNPTPRQILFGVNLSF